MFQYQIAHTVLTARGISRSAPTADGRRGAGCYAAMM
jgi:hypothetical protein